jgi:glycosyltransferase involved in cell wall biosynthesis
MIKLQIVIPCFNEGPSLNRLWEECLRVVKESQEIQFIIVDNGSKDETREIVASKVGLNPNIIFITLDVNKGYGGGILAGLERTSSKFVGWTHADAQTPLFDCVTGGSLLDSGFDFVKGKRKGRRLDERFFSFGMGLLMSVLFKRSLMEINAQPTLFKREFLADWSSPPKDFSLDLYAFIMARRLGLKIARFEVNFLSRIHGHSKWNFGLTSRLKFIRRTLRYAFILRGKIK